MELKDQVVVITGASAGIGLATARRLAKDGAQLVLAARSEEKLSDIAREITDAGGVALAVRTDVTSPVDLSALVEKTLHDLGRIDVLVNNAGVECFNYFEKIDEAEIALNIQTNLTSAILLTRLVIPHMLQQGSGAVINMASTAGKHCPAFGSVYGATKAALIGFTEGLRGEYLARGITATAICPGFTRDGGIYDRLVQAAGRKSSRFVGSTTAKEVADAVAGAIRSGKPQVIVNWPPVRPAMALKEIAPRLGELLIVRASRRFMKGAVDARQDDEAG